MKRQCTVDSYALVAGSYTEYTPSPVPTYCTALYISVHIYMHSNTIYRVQYV